MRNRNEITRGCETCISYMLLQSDLNKWWLPQLENDEKDVLVQHQPGFYKYIRNIMINTRIKYFQTFPTLISDTMMLHHHIIVLLQ